MTDPPVQEASTHDFSRTRRSLLTRLDGETDADQYYPLTLRGELHRH